MEDITLSCDVIIAARPSASSISATDIASMSTKEVTNCLGHPRSLAVASICHEVHLERCED